MVRSVRRVLALAQVPAIVILLLGCADSQRPFVVVYTSTDQVEAAAVFDVFERETGIEVRPVFDSEAQKTTGLAMRLLAEKERPQADVFWNNELSRTLSLLSEGALEPFDSRLADSIPSTWKDAGGAWAAFAWRARVIVYNTEKLNEDVLPGTLDELTNPKWRNNVAIANPLFGTTAAHAAALACVRGEGEAISFFNSLDYNGARVYEGNSVVRDAIANGEVLLGLTDTDDVLLGIARGMKIGMVFPDQGEGGFGTLVMPNSVALVAGAPHPDEAERLIAYLLSPECEVLFSVPAKGWFPVRHEAGGDVPGMPETLAAMPVDWKDVSDIMADFSRTVAEILD